MRVVSLLPSATEIVCALGVEPVGVSHECDHPPRVADLPAVNRSRVDADATAGEIDDQVAAAEADGGVYEIRRDVLADLDPDLVVSQGICDVCAVDRVLVEEAVADLGIECEVLTTDPHSLADVFADVERLGRALDREARATELVADLRDRVAAIEAAVPEGPDRRPRTAVLDWLDPVMVAGHWVPGMVERVGGSYGLAEPGARSRPRECAAIREYDPEVLVAAPCGFDLEHTVAELADLTGRPGFGALEAARRGRVYVLDGHHHVNRPGPRLVDSLAFLAWCLHPGSFDEPPDGAVRQVDPVAP